MFSLSRVPPLVRPRGCTVPAALGKHRGAFALLIHSSGSAPTTSGSIFGMAPGRLSGSDGGSTRRVYMENGNMKQTPEQMLSAAVDAIRSQVRAECGKASPRNYAPRRTAQAAWIPQVIGSTGNVVRDPRRS